MVSPRHVSVVSITNKSPSPDIRLIDLASNMVDAGDSESYQQFNEIIEYTVPQDSFGTDSMLKISVMLRSRVKAGNGTPLTANEVPDSHECNLINALLHQLLQQNGNDWEESTAEMTKLLVPRLVVHV